MRGLVGRIRMYAFPFFVCHRALRGEGALFVQSRNTLDESRTRRTFESSRHACGLSLSLSGRGVWKGRRPQVLLRAGGESARRARGARGVRELRHARRVRRRTGRGRLRACARARSAPQSAHAAPLGITNDSFPHVPHSTKRDPPHLPYSPNDYDGASRARHARRLSCPAARSAASRSCASAAASSPSSTSRSSPTWASATRSQRTTRTNRSFNSTSTPRSPLFHKGTSLRLS